jgi:hypothetical protein
MLELLERQKRLTANQWKIIATAGAFAFWFIGFETKGRSSEEIDDALAKPAPAKARVA